MKKLNFWIPEKCNSLNEAISNITKELQKKIDIGEILLAGLNIASLIICVIVTIANIVIQNGSRIYKKLKNREKINWCEELIDAGLGALLSLSKIKGVKG